MFKLFLGAVCIGFAPIFVRVLSLGPTLVGAYRCGFAALLLLGYIRFLGKPFHPLTWPKELWKFICLAGLLFGLDLFVWHRSVIFAGAGMGTILGNTQVLYVALVGIYFHKEKITSSFLLAIALAFVGIYLLVHYQLPSEIKPEFALGVTYGLITGIIYASYILTMRRLESFSEIVPREQVLAFVSAIASLSLFASSAVEGVFRLPTGNEWSLLILLAFVAQVMGWLLITKNLRLVPVSSAGLIINAQPVVAVIAGNLILNEHLSTMQICGALLTLSAIYLGTQKKQTTSKSQ